MWIRRKQISRDGWTSIVFPPGRVEVSRVHRSGGEKPEVQAWESFALEGGELGALKRLKSAKRIGRGQCTTLLHQGQYQLLQTEAPQVPAQELREAMRWRIKEMVDFPVDQAVIDVLDIPAAQAGPGRAPLVFAVAASNIQLSPRIHLFQDARIPLAAIDIPELAQRNVAALFEDENRALALLAFDNEGGRLTFNYRGELLAFRTIDIKREELAASGADGKGHYDRALLEIQRSLDNFERSNSHISLSRLLVAALPGGNDFIEFLKENLYQPVELLDLASAIDISPVPALADPVVQSEALLAIGAALRSEAAA